MKRLLKSSAGVTLLEIMLVLAIASMVIVMSIRYYQNASTSQNSNVMLEQIEAITAAADNMAQGSGSYSGAVSTTSGVSAVLGAKNMITPYLGTIALSSGNSTSYVASVPANAASCIILKSKLSTNTRYASPACNSGTLSYTYTSNIGS